LNPAAKAIFDRPTHPYTVGRVIGPTLNEDKERFQPIADCCPIRQPARGCHLAALPVSGEKCSSEKKIDRV
jgi:ABC-type dipeptide/oligopeptide/nickel transport system ATPase component